MYKRQDYGGAAGPGTGMTLKQCAGMSCLLYTSIGLKEGDRSVYKILTGLIIVTCVKMTKIVIC